MAGRAYIGNLVNTNSNNYVDSGGSMLKKKYANKFNKVSSNKLFSLNGNTNHSYIGNPNSIISQDPFSSVLENKCCNNKNANISVKNTKGYLDSKCGMLNSAQCYKTVNAALVDISGSLNKHFRAENRVQSSHINNIKALCSLNRTSYSNEINNKAQQITCNKKINRNLTSSSRIEHLKKCNNTVKDNNLINGFTPGYDIYYNDSTLYKKKAACNLHNPPDAKVIAC